MTRKHVEKTTLNMHKQSLRNVVPSLHTLNPTFPITATRPSEWQTSGAGTCKQHGMRGAVAKNQAVDKSQAKQCDSSRCKIGNRRGVSVELQRQQGCGSSDEGRMQLSDHGSRLPAGQVDDSCKDLLKYMNVSNSLVVHVTVGEKCDCHEFAKWFNDEPVHTKKHEWDQQKNGLASQIHANGTRPKDQSEG